MPRPYVRTKPAHVALPATRENIAKSFLSDLLDGTIKAESSKWHADADGKLLFVEYAEPHMLDVTGVLDSTAALQALLQPTRPANAINDQWGKTRMAVSLPAGANIRISSQIVIDDPVIVHGNGARIFCDANDARVDMILINPTAARTLFKEVDLFTLIPGVQLADNDKKAVDIHAPKVGFEDCWIYGFGYGIWDVPDEQDGNTNRLFLKNVDITDFRRQGLTCRGIDCSGNTFLGVTVFVGQNHFSDDGVVNNGFGPAIGVEESSSNGSTHIGTVIELTGSSTVSKGLLVNPAGGIAPSTFVGVYIEAGDTAEWRGDYALRTTTVGGHLATRESTKGDRVGGLRSRLSFRAEDTNGVPYSVTIPATANQSYLSFQSGDANDAWLLKRERPTATTYRVALQHFLNQGTDLLGVQAVNTNGVWAVDPFMDGVT